ncbi:MAG: AraC family transcriptional regulator [Microbacterium sp.]|nr:AraC family transcriptional regulator [Microbacterium sp.]
MDVLRGLLERHVLAGPHAGIDGVRILRSDHGVAPEPSMSGTVLAVMAQGGRRLETGGRSYEYGVGEYLVASVDSPVVWHVEGAEPGRPALGLVLTLEPAVIADLLLQADPADLPPLGDAAQPGIAVGDASEELIEAIVRLLRLIDRPQDQRVMVPLIKREIFWQLMTGAHGDIVRELGLVGSSLSHVTRSVRWIREHYTQPFRVAEMARLSGMSRPAFYRNFQVVTGMSPIQFQKRIRLQCARVQLANHPNDITGISHRVGYSSASQFSREYRRLFGAPPSVDATQLRLERS